MRVRGEPKGLVIRRDIHQAAAANRPAVNAVDRPDGADLAAGIHADFDAETDGAGRRGQHEQPGQDDRGAVRQDGRLILCIYLLMTTTPPKIPRLACAAFIAHQS